jgi:hypothetical protein
MSVVYPLQLRTDIGANMQGAAGGHDMPRKRIASPAADPLNEEVKAMPISGRMKELRGEDLTDFQKSANRRIHGQKS